jgi:hypothetical protein
LRAVKVRGSRVKAKALEERAGDRWKGGEVKLHLRNESGRQRLPEPVEGIDERGR